MLFVVVAIFVVIDQCNGTNVTSFEMQGKTRRDRKRKKREKFRISKNEKMEKLSKLFINERIYTERNIYENVIHLITTKPMLLFLSTFS